MPRRTTKQITLVLGGARSGKSRYAQAMASAFKRVVYIATAKSSDAEMRAKIARHRRERPAAWKTVEVTKALDRTILEEGANADVLLIDCLTIYAAHMMGHGKGGTAKMKGQIQALCEALQKSKATLILVSNEVGSGVVPAYQSGREYRDLLGELNQKVASVADEVILMVAGLPLTVKG